MIRNTDAFQKNQVPNIYPYCHMSLHEQLISRNHQNLAEVIQEFHELNDCYQGQFCIYMDSQVWELFDTRIATDNF